MIVMPEALGWRMGESIETPKHSHSELTTVPAEAPGGAAAVDLIGQPASPRLLARGLLAAQ